MRANPPRAVRRRIDPYSGLRLGCSSPAELLRKSFSDRDDAGASVKLVQLIKGIDGHRNPLELVERLLWICAEVRMSPWHPIIKARIHSDGELRVETTVHGLLLAAERTGRLHQVGAPVYYDGDGGELELAEPADPYACRVEVQVEREGGIAVYTGTARIDEDAIGNEWWDKRARRMLHLRALGYALRLAFPELGVLGLLHDAGEGEVQTQRQEKPAAAPAREERGGNKPLPRASGGRRS